MAEPNVLVERDGRVGVVLMNRPKQLNALSGELMDAVVAALTELDDDPEIRAIVLGGSERAFAAGADIGELSAATPVTLYENRRLDKWDAIRKVRTPIVAAVSGFCLGGGCELAMLCDLVVAVRVGEVRPAGDQPRRAPRRRRHAAAHARGRQGARDGHDPHRPHAVGARGALVRPRRRVVAKEAWLDEAKRVAGEIAAKAPVAVRLAKEAIDQAFESPLAAGVELERRSFFLARASEDADEGLRAFLEKRPPDFTGARFRRMAEVEVARDGAVQTITLNRPDVLNAFNRALHAGLRDALKEARDPDVRAVVITGAGRGFCAGQDLTEFQEAPDVGGSLRETYHPNVLAIRALEKPVIAAVNGACAGAGLSLACACDIRIASDERGVRPRLRRDRPRSRTPAARTSSTACSARRARSSGCRPTGG